MTNIIDWKEKAFSNDRTLFRQEVVQGFLQEQAGQGRGDLTSKYRYIVAEYDEHEIYLQRPAQFNNGFDFTLNVSGINFNPDGRRTTRPTHNNILDDLNLKKSENIILYQHLKDEIEAIFECRASQTNWNDLIFQSGLATPILLHCIKWLFVEQDITYWNYSGRYMLWNSINRI